MSEEVFKSPMEHPHIDDTCFLSVAEAQAMIASDDDGMAHTLQINPGICGCDIPLKRIHEAIKSMGGAYLAKCGTAAYDLDHRIAIQMPGHEHWTFIETL